MKAILFDLDNTLLINPMSRFLPAYLAALGDYLSSFAAPEKLIEALLKATRLVNQNDGSGATNEETLAASFYPDLGVRRADLEPRIRQFYLEEYPRLRSLTHPRAGARKLVERTFQRGFHTVIATNPLFPRIALEQRLLWAGVPVTEFDYALVTALENMHATKAHPAYYLEIARCLGLRTDDCLMIGDDWERDVVPAASVAMTAFWVTDSETSRTDKISLASPERLLGQGTLESVWEMLT